MQGFFWFFLVFFYLKTWSHYAAQAGFEFITKSCLIFSSAGITEMYHHALLPILFVCYCF
jgi:hypothetical protein